MRARSVAAAVLVAGACLGLSCAGTRKQDEPRVPGGLPLVGEMRSRNPPAYAFDLSRGVRIVPSPSTGAFAVTSTSPRRPRAVVVVVHGHNGNAFAEYRLWQPFAARHGYGLVAVEWQLRFGADTRFLGAGSTYALIERSVRAQGVEAGRVLLHGFSQGSHEAFALTALDHAGPRLFALTIAESGGAHDYAPAPRALAGTRWVLYCAGRDHWPTITGCPAMRAAGAYLLGSGARIEDFIVDPPAQHGGLLRNPREVELALRYFRRAMTARG